MVNKQKSIEFKKPTSLAGRYEGPDLSEDQMAAVDAILKGKGPFFLTGEAGSGKSFLIDYLRTTQSRCVVTAMTGTAAQLIKGRTLHKFASLHPTYGVVDSKLAYWRVRDCDLLIIDEISMASHEILEQLHERFNRCKHWPKLVMVGDFLQLPPVEGQKLFEAANWGDCQVIKLTQQHRQSEPDFIGPLNDIRLGNLTEKALEMIASRTVDELPDDCVHLMAYRRTVYERNMQKLEELPGIRAKSKMSLETALDRKGNQKKPNLKELERSRFNHVLYLKIGARIVMLTNDRDNRWVNGSTGEVTYIEKGLIEVLLDNGREVSVRKEIEEILDGDGKPTCRLTQYPLQLAWALTIHKGQGMTLDKVGVNLNGHFDSGQTYVALSRCRTKDGLYLVGEISELLVDPMALELWLTGSVTLEPD